MELNDCSVSFPLSVFTPVYNAEIFACSGCHKFPTPETVVEHIDCGKLFCAACVKSLKNVCPICKKSPLDTRSIKDQNKFVFAMMLGLKLHCPSTAVDSTKDNKCEWSGEVSGLAEHLAACGHILVQCPNGCGKRAIKKLMIQHETAECPHRVVKCKNCGKGVPLSKMEEHEDECEMNPTKARPCRFAAAGCDFEGVLAERKKHEELGKDKHLELFAAHLKLEAAIIQPSYFTVCTKGHPLKNTFVADQTYECDVCGKKGMNHAEGTWECELCGWHCCPVCHGKGFVEKGWEPQKHSLCPKRHILIRTKKLTEATCKVCGKKKQHGSFSWCPYCSYAVCVECQNPDA